MFNHNAAFGFVSSDLPAESHKNNIMNKFNEIKSRDGSAKDHANIKCRDENLQTPLYLS